MSVTVNITKRERQRKLKSGALVSQTRWVINYREPGTGKRRQLFFARAADAQLRRNAIITEIGTGTYSETHRSVTIADVMRRWLANREGEIKSGSLEGYRQTAPYVIGPLLSGTKAQRTEYTLTGKLPEGTRLLPMLGDVKVQELTTGQIRTWHRTLSSEVSAYSANRAKMYLAAALALAAEDMNNRPPAMPTKLGRGNRRRRSRS